MNRFRIDMLHHSKRKKKHIKKVFLESPSKKLFLQFPRLLGVFFVRNSSYVLLYFWLLLYSEISQMATKIKPIKSGMWSFDMFEC